MRLGAVRWRRRFVPLGVSLSQWRHSSYWSVVLFFWFCVFQRTRRRPGGPCFAGGATVAVFRSREPDPGNTGRYLLPNRRSLPTSLLHFLFTFYLLLFYWNRWGWTSPPPPLWMIHRLMPILYGGHWMHLVISGQINSQVCSCC